MKNKSIFLVLVLLASFTSEAQIKRSGREDTIKTTQTTVYSYRPTVSDAKKLAESPSTIDTVLAKPEAQFAFETQQLQTTYKPDSIKAARMKGEPLSPLYRSFVKGGVGNGINYLFDGHINALRSRDGALGIEVHGKGTQGVLNELPSAPYNRWNTALSGKRFLKKHQVTGSAGYDRERIQYYGYDYNDTLIAPYYIEYQDNEDVFRQVYTDIYANVGLKSFYTDSAKLNHSADVHYDYFFDRNAANQEHNVRFDGRLSRYLKGHLGSIDAMADMNAVNYMDEFYSYSYDTIAQQRSNVIVGLTPKFTSQTKKLRVEVGVNLQMSFQANVTDLRLYPDLYAKYNLVKEIIIPYAGLNGGLKRNNLKNLTETNPFLWTGLTVLRVTDREYHAYGGFRGSVSKRFTYNLHAGQFRDRDAPLFVNYNASGYNPGLNPFGVNYFIVEYDTITTFEFGGELTYRIGERLHVVGSGVFRKYTTQQEAVAWQRPNFEVSATGIYQIQDKIVLRAGVHILGPQSAKGLKAYDANDTESVDVQEYNGQLFSVTNTAIAPIFDVNLGVEYRYTERLSGFLNMHNMVVQRYQRWNNYPVQRFNIMAGITYSFWKE
ncbi:MAG: hypothetical protein RLP15_09125 [Cryomorphaceae bacterium]